MNEQELIDRAARGDGPAFNELLGSHEKRMYAICLRMCGNPDDAQDCLQEAMLRVFRAIGSFKSQSAFSTWLYRVTMNTCLDEFRRKKNKQSVSLDAMLETGWSPAGEEAIPEKHMIEQEQRSAVRAAIADLPEDMRSVIVLRDVQGFSYEEIAGILDANIGTVKSRISRGREKLREKIMQHPELFGYRGV